MSHFHNVAYLLRSPCRRAPHGLRVVFASVAGQSGEQALQTLLGFTQADFRYDPDSLLLDVPQLDQELESLAQRFVPRRTSVYVPTV